MKWLLIYLAALLSSYSVLSGESDLDIGQFNEKFGKPLFAMSYLWGEKDADVAARLEIPLLSATRTEKIFQCYPEKYKILNEDVVYAALYSDNGKPSYLYFVFANMGDFAEKFKSTGAAEIRKKILDDYNDLGIAITRKLGKPIPVSFKTPYAYSAKIWGWKLGDTAIALSCPYDMFVELRILPLAEAKKGTITERIPADQIDFTGRVAKEACGDVVVSDVLMIDQGNKGYCAPATYERFLRYYGFNTELYTLAGKMKTGKNGTRSFEVVNALLDDFATSSDYKVEFVKSDLHPEKLCKYLDKGYPLVWYIICTEELRRIAQSRKEKRINAIKDVQAYRKMLTQEEVKTLPALRKAPDRDGHTCLIIGYNAITREVAYTDSWGKEYTLEWITEKEAEVVTQAAPMATLTFQPKKGGKGERPRQ